MNAIALALLFLIRVLMPVSLLIALGEWVHRRETNYWLRM